jgi:hypothetical protein
MKIVSVIFLIMCLLVLVLVLSGTAKAQEQERVITKYNIPGGQEVKLIFKSTGAHESFFVLQIAAKKNETHEELLSILESEVKRLTRTKGGETPLGKTSYVFVFTGGFPLWRTYSESGTGYEYLQLTFAWGEKIVGKKIWAVGAPTPDEKHYLGSK